MIYFFFKFNGKYFVCILINYLGNLLVIMRLLIVTTGVVILQAAGHRPPEVQLRDPAEGGACQTRDPCCHARP